MSSSTRVFLLLTAAFATLSGSPQDTSETSSGPQYTSDAQLMLPLHYRDWIYLTSGFDMSYTAGMNMGDRHVFDNVFADPAAYRSFTRTGTWPDKTMLVLELRAAQSKGSINQKGNFQSTDPPGIEVHVKNEARFPGKWAFFSFDNGKKVAKMIPTTADCYTCHIAHAAVDTTFVQFYPTLLPIATSHQTFSAEYKKDLATPTK